MIHGWNGAGFSGGYAFGFPYGGFIMTALFAALIVLAVLAIIRASKAGKYRDDPKERGLEILIERFSRGEIDAATFKSMKAEIDSKN